MAGKLILKITAGCLTLAIIGCLSSVVGSAVDLSDYEQRQKELDSQAREYQSILDQTKSDIEQKEEYQNALLNKITVLNEQIANGRAEISSLDEQISELQTEINEATDSISDRMETLKTRLRAIYLSGETTSLEIIFGAKSFEDFLDKVELVSYMSNSDKKMIDQLRSEIQSINEKKNEMADKKADLNEEQENLDSRQAELQDLMLENQEMINSLYEDNAAAQDHLDENSAERQEIEDAIMAYYADKQAQEDAARIASEAQKQLEESRLAQQQTESGNVDEDAPSYDDTSSRNESQQDSVSSSVSSNTTSSKVSSSSKASSSQTAPPVSSQITSSVAEPELSSGYVWPLPGHYTLTSMWNEDRGSYNHGAIDIADGTVMNAAVVAAESGTVVLSNDDCIHNYAKEDSCGCGGGYGNYLMIDHGGGKATLYAHLTSLTVSSGTYVQKGQVIGYVGSTGWSTGPHLHFETRLNGEKYNPMTEYPNM